MKERGKEESMIKNNFSEKENWYENGYESVKLRQVEMIKRHYVDYVEGNWVLWIVPTLFHDYESAEIAGNIEIKKRVDAIQIPYMVRTPYPNKHINQLSMKSGRKRLYGIPLIFQTFEELQKITEITICWSVYEKWNLNTKIEKPLDIHFNSLTVKYYLSFEQDTKEPDNRFFTINSSDKFPYVYEDIVENRRKKGLEKGHNYYDEFDTALEVSGSLIWYDEGEDTEFVCADIFDLKAKNGESGRQLTKEEQKNVDYMNEIRPDKPTINRLLQEVVCTCEMQSHMCYQERSESLTAKYMADILPESSFGF